MKTYLFAWFKSKNISAHSIAVVGLTLASLITLDPAVRNLLLLMFKDHPSLASDIVILAGIVFRYSHSSSAAGNVAQAQQTLAAPNPPTPAAVAQIRAFLK